MAEIFYKGAQSICGFGVETTWGTQATAFRKFGIPTGTTDPVHTATVKNLMDMNLAREGTSQTTTMDKYEIKTAFYVNDYYGLMAIMGKVTKTGSNAPFTYTFTPNEADIPAFSFYHQIDNRDPARNIKDVYVGCKIKTAVFSINEGLLMCELTFSAKDRNDNQTGITVTSNTQEPYKYADVVNGEIQINSQNIQMDEWSLTIDNKLIERQAGLLISEQSITNIEYNQTAKGQMHTTDVRNLIGGSEVPFSIKFTRGTNDTLEFASNVVIMSAPNPTAKAETVNVNIAPSTRTMSIVYVSNSDINVPDIVL